MRVLCLDTTGILGKLPSPVLLPEYGERFFHLADISGDTNANMLSYFLHANDQSHEREVWLLWRTGTDRQLIELTTQKYVQHFSEIANVSIYHLLIESVGSGEQSGKFFDIDRSVYELQVCDKLRAKSNDLRTVLIGIHDGNLLDKAQFEIAVALSLRFWLTRERVAARWPELAYRVLCTFQNDNGAISMVPVMAQIQDNWSRAFSQIKVAAEYEDSRCCESLFVSKPRLLSVQFPNKSILWPSLCGWFLSPSKGLNVIYKDDDVCATQNWVNLVFGLLEKAIQSAFSDVETLFQKERQSLFASSAQAVDKSDMNPKQAVAYYEKELQRLNEHKIGKTRSEDLLKELKKDQSIWMLRLLDIITIRPNGRMASLYAFIALVFVGGLFSFNELIILVTPHGSQLPGELWYFAAFLAVFMSVTWALYRSQLLVRNCERALVDLLKRKWQNAQQIHNSTIDALNHSLERIVVMRNLEIAKKEMSQRNRHYAQIGYHINLLNDYYKTLFGRDIEVEKGCQSQVEFDVAAPQSGNPVYSWQSLDSRVKVSAQWKADEVFNLIELVDQRLAGLESMEIRCVSPDGRRGSPK